MATANRKKQSQKSLKNARARLKRRDEKIVRLEAELKERDEKAKKKSPESYGTSSPDYGKTIPGHQFSEFVVRLAICIRCATGCSPRDIVKIIEIISNLTFGLVDKVPCANTIDLWTRKCGLDDLKHTSEAIADKEIAVITDECMMIGNEKLLPVLTIPAEHQGRPIQPGDVNVIGFNVKQGWTAETTKDAIKDNVATVGKDPKYVITDNDSKMKKAVQLSGYTWHRDISHTLAMFMERTYKNDADFVKFNELMATSKKQFCMKDIAYLQSPSMRVKARFMNLSYWVIWAYSMLQAFYGLKPYEQKVFSFIPMYSSLIYELKEMISCIRYIETEMKCHGLSKATIEECRKHISTMAIQKNSRMQQVIQQILDYFAEEENQLGENEVVNNSSDIIESMFGTFKNMQSPNKLNGVTTLVLHLPVMFALKESPDSKNYNVNVRLCRTRVKDITQWRDENLSENLVRKRINTLSA